MNTHVDKIPDNKSQSVANGVSQKQGADENTYQFEDNRPETVAQRKHQGIANNSPQAKKAAQLKAIIDNNSAQQKRLIQEKANKTGLPDNLKSGIENLSGLPMDDVRVHYNSDKPAQLQAHAYAQGTDIHLASGQEKHLPHEAWHVVQQKQGRVLPNVQAKGVAINDDQNLEHEADVMGQRSANAGPSPLSSEEDPTGADRSASEPMPSQSANPLQRHSPSPGVKQLKGIEHDNPNVAPKGARAGVVDVQNIRGDTYGESHNSPSIDDVFGWQQLYAAGHTLGNPNSTHYNAVRMHLWNGRLDGPGNEKWNLAPGPATTNSSMSAGPETAAKLAVDSGSRIWLRTEVFYQNNGIDANDFTNVVPNRMKMEWGYMYTATNAVAPRNDIFGNATSVKRGPAMPPAWDEAIDQPAGAMTETRKNEYRALKDGQTAELDNMFATVSTQEKAQAFEVVTDTLKRHIILKYAEVYLSMAEATRAQVLTLLGLPDVLHLIQNVLHINQANRLISEIYFPLIASGQTARLQEIYKNSAAIVSQDEQVVTGKWELIQHLGNEVSWLLRSDYRYFKYVPHGQQPAILDTVPKIIMGDFVRSFPTGTTRRDVFNNWAKSKGYAKPSEWLNFISTKVDAKWALEYQKNLKWRLKQEKSNPRVRPIRTSKKPKGFF